MLLRVLVLAASLCGVANADAIAFWCVGAKNVQVALTRDGSCGSFRSTDASGKTVSSAIFDVSASGELFATADGRSVIYVAGSPAIDDHTDGVIVFRDGKIVARYPAKDLLVRPDLVTHTASHIRWLHQTPAVDKPLGAAFEFTTTSWRTYQIDVVTGKQSSATDAPEWKKCDAIVYDGQGMHVQHGTGTIDTPAVAKGKIKGKISFAIAPDVNVSDRDSGVTLCLVADGGRWRAIEKLDVMYNALAPSP